MAIADVPKNGWLLYAPATGEFIMANGNLRSLAVCFEGIYERTRAKCPDACIVHCFELGRRMELGLSSVVSILEPSEGES